MMKTTGVIEGSGKENWIGLYLEVDNIVVPKQSRKIDAGALKELASSIKTHGVLTPILIRPHTPTPDSAREYELVFGERRLRAAKLAGLKVIPATVRDMTDAEALEARIIENLQREGAHPLQESDNYRELIEKHGYTAADVASKVAKSKAYVYGRLKLAALEPSARKAFLEGRITVSVAELIARIPVPKLQAEAVTVMGRGTWDDKNQTWSTRAAFELIQCNYMLALTGASFSTTDPELVPAAGACVTCPKRTGNQRELFADVKSNDVCTDPTCFEKKRVAHWAIVEADAAESGDRVLTGAEAIKAFPGGLLPSHEYVDLEAKCLDDPKKRKYKTLLGKGDVDHVVAKDAAGNVRRLATASSVSKALNSEGHHFAKKAAAASAKLTTVDKRARAAAKLRKGVALEAMHTIAGSKKPSDAALWRLLIGLADDSIWSSSKEAVFERLELEVDKKKSPGVRERKIAAKIKTLNAAQARSVVLQLFLQESIDAMGLPQARGYPARLVEASKHFGVDIKKLEAAAKAKQLEASKVRIQIVAPRTGRKK